jgi:hypothetical protein
LTYGDLNPARSNIDFTIALIRPANADGVVLPEDFNEKIKKKFPV